MCLSLLLGADVTKLIPRALDLRVAEVHRPAPHDPVPGLDQFVAGPRTASASLQQFLGYQEWAGPAPLKSNAAARTRAAARRQTTDGEPNEKSARLPLTKAMMIFWARERSHSWNDVCVAREARTDHAATRVPMRVGGGLGGWDMPGTSDKLADAMSWRALFSKRFGGSSSA